LLNDILKRDCEKGLHLRENLHYTGLLNKPSKSILTHNPNKLTKKKDE